MSHGLGTGPRIAGIGQTAFAKQLDEPEGTCLALKGHRRQARRRRHRPRRGRRPRQLHHGAHRGDRDRPQPRARRHHLVQPDRLRRWRGVRDGRERRARGRRRAVLGWRVAWRSRKRGAAAGRPWAGRVQHGSAASSSGAGRVGSAAGGRDRHADPPVHARLQGRLATTCQRRARLPDPRQPQPRRDHAGTSR